MKLPVLWQNGGTGERAGVTESRVIIPGEEEMAGISLTGQICGNCRHFARREGQKRMDDQRFLERLVREDKWKVEHLGAPPTELGLCGLSVGGDTTRRGAMLTSWNAKGCGEWAQAWKEPEAR